MRYILILTSLIVYFINCKPSIDIAKIKGSASKTFGIIPDKMPGG